MYYFIRNMWTLGRLCKEQVESYVEKGFITSEESAEILALPQKQDS